MFLILALIFTLIIALPGFAAAEGRPGFFKRITQSWGNSLTGWIPFLNKNVEGPADIYGWYNNTFFTLDKWEAEVCLLDMSSNVRKFQDSTSSFSSQFDDNIYTTTITLAAKREPFNETEMLYDVAWYIMPYNFDISYRVYLIDEQGKKFYPPNDDKGWKSAPRYIGGNDFIAFYSHINFLRAVLEYNETTTKTFQVPIVNTTLNIQGSGGDNYNPLDDYGEYEDYEDYK